MKINCASCNGTGLKTIRYFGFYDATIRCYCKAGDNFQSFPREVSTKNIAEVKELYGNYIDGREGTNHDRLNSSRNAVN